MAFDKSQTRQPPRASLLGAEDLPSLAGRRCMVSWSGGKDSCLAMHRAARAGARIEVLVNMKVEGGERSRSHGLRSGVIDAQAKAMGVRLDGMATSWDNYEANVVSILGRLVSEGIEAGIFGDIDLHAHLDWGTTVSHSQNNFPLGFIYAYGSLRSEIGYLPPV
ncbi:MAG: hypothetical protein KGY40_06055, partial [Thioalkalivibrio sp.]|nr:hypothetical protein [Thioalkalivibrio sp.]